MGRKEIESEESGGDGDGLVVEMNTQGESDSEEENHRAKAVDRGAPRNPKIILQKPSFDHISGEGSSSEGEEIFEESETSSQESDDPEKFEPRVGDGLEKPTAIASAVPGGGFKGETADGLEKASTDDGETLEASAEGEAFSGLLGLILADGSSYEGNFRDGVYDGQGKLMFADGSSYEGNFRDGAYDGQGKLIFTDGGSYEGNFRDGVYDGYGKLIGGDGFSNDTLWEGEFARGKRKNVFLTIWKNGLVKHIVYNSEEKPLREQILPREPERDRTTNRLPTENLGATLLEPLVTEEYEYHRVDFQESHITKYHLYGADGKPTQTVGVDYGKLNALLSAGQLKTPEDLLEAGVLLAMEGNSARKFKSFGEASACLKKVLEENLRQRARIGKSGFDGGYPEEINLVALANLEKIETLQNVRFMPKKVPLDTVTSFLESYGISRKNLDSIPGDSISLPVPTSTMDHVVNFTVDLKKLRDVGWGNLDRSKEVFFYCYDSSRAVGCPDYRGDFGALMENSRALNYSQQKGGTCWYNAVAAMLAAAENPRLLGDIESGKIKLHKFGEGEYGDPDEIPNGFMLKQMEMVQRIGDKVGIGRVNDGTMAEQVISGNVRNRLETLSRDRKLLKNLRKEVDRATLALEKKLKETGRGDDFRKYREEIREEYGREFLEKINAIQNRLEETGGIAKEPAREAAPVAKASAGYQREGEPLEKGTASGKEAAQTPAGKTGERCSEFMKSIEKLNLLDEYSQNIEKKLEEKLEQRIKREKNETEVGGDGPQQKKKTEDRGYLVNIFGGGRVNGCDSQGTKNMVAPGIAPGPRRRATDRGIP
ncbi:MAG: hypothetical protein LBU15_01165 [Rickettsiales bacterium]|jgi:hypothetical protein|nr:hypothetical protein [Rickettsiales bacterium]